MNENSPRALVVEAWTHWDVADFSCTWTSPIGRGCWSWTTPRTLPTSAARSGAALNNIAAASSAARRLIGIKEFMDLSSLAIDMRTRLLKKRARRAVSIQASVGGPRGG